MNLVGGYFARRLLYGLLAVLCAAALVFFVARWFGDPAALMAPPEASIQQVAEIKHQLGLDRPLLEQFGEFLLAASRGDLGKSIRQGRPALGLVLSTLPNTLVLTGAALLLAVVVGVPAGVIAARRRDSFVDTLTMTGSVVGQSVPMFWLGLLLIMVFAVWLRVLPASGMGGLRHLVLPAITLSTYSMAKTARLVRSSMLEVLGLEYMTTARAKGLSERAVLVGHGLRNALIPVSTIIALDLGVMLGGAVVVETVFAWPGIGRLVVTAIQTRDFPVIQAAVIVIAVLFVGLNVIVDLVYTLLDPRIRYE